MKTLLKHPTVTEFIALRNTTGWPSVDEAMVKASLKGTLFFVCIYDTESLIGMGRVVGDGAMYFYIQDVIVAPEYQGQGIGDRLMREIEAYLSEKARPGSTIGLLAAKGKEAFYSRYQYLERPSDSMGNGMCKFVR